MPETTQSVTVSIGADGTGWATITGHAPEDVSVTAQPASGTASVEPVDGQPTTTCIKVVNAQPSSPVSVGVTIREHAADSAQVKCPVCGFEFVPGSAHPTDEKAAAAAEQAAEAELAPDAQPEPAQPAEPAPAAAGDAAASPTAGTDAAAEPAGEQGAPPVEQAPVESDAAPQAAGTVPSESAGTAEQAGSPSEETAAGDSQHAESGAATEQQPADAAGAEAEPQS
jgi:hypothetical protein